MIYIFFNEVLKELGITNRLIKFTNPLDAYHFLDNSAEQPFLIVCDVNLPQMSGLEFKTKLDANEKTQKEVNTFYFLQHIACRKKYVMRGLYATYSTGIIPKCYAICRN